MDLRVGSALALFALALPAGAPAADSAPQRAALTIAIDLVASDARGRGLSDLKASDLEVSQEGMVQAIESLTPDAQAGHYTLRYRPRSGKPAGVTVRPLRAGLTIAGPDGAFLKPRLEPGLSPLEAELAALLRSEARADQIPLSLSVLQFDASAEQHRQTLAIETPLAALSDPIQAVAPRLQLLAQVMDDAGRVVQRLSDDRSIEGAFAGPQRVVWTGRMRLPSGRYAVDALVRNPMSGASAVRHASFAVAPGRAALRMSSICLLQPADAVVLPAVGSADDDPLRFAGEPLMPTLDLALPPGTQASVRFFVTLYPNPASTRPVSLRFELESSAGSAGAGAIALPAADADGAIRYVGHFPTRMLREGEFTLRLRAGQAEAEATSEARFRISADANAVPVRISQ